MCGWILDGDKRLELFSSVLLERSYARLTGFNHDLLKVVKDLLSRFGKMCPVVFG
jgi:hypothetical protein